MEPLIGMMAGLQVRAEDALGAFSLFEVGDCFPVFVCCDNNISICCALQDVPTEIGHPIRLYCRYVDKIYMYFR